jgi:hypothetical protein
MVGGVQPLSLGARLVLAWTTFFAVLLDGLFAARVRALRAPAGAAPASEPEPAEPTPRPKRAQPKVAEPAPPAAPAEAPAEASAEARRALRVEGALLALAALQREGRLVDFLQEDVSKAQDAQLGAAARVVHAGCRRALADLLELGPVRPEDEGARVTVEQGYDPSSLKLVGNVAGSGPWKGQLVHRGWRARDARLPEPVGVIDLAVLAPAEVEL